MEARYLLVLAITWTFFQTIFPVAVCQEPHIILTPNITRPGEGINLRGYDLPNKQAYELRIDGEFFNSGTTLLNGTLNRDLILPRTISLGNHTMNLTSADIFAAANFTIIQWTPELSFSPASVYPGMAIDIHGSGYPPNAAYWIYLDGAETLSGATDESGGFTRAYQLSKTIPIGPHDLSTNATQYFGPPSARTTLNVSQWPVTVDVEPDTAYPGRSITITGTDFPPNSLYEVKLDGNVIKNGQADNDGFFQNSYQLPSTISLDHHVIYGMATDYSGQPGDNETIDVVQWPAQLSADPPFARSGEAVTLQGVNLPPNAPFKIYLDDLQVRFGTTNSLGELQVQYILPKALSTGSHDFTATITGFTGPPTATTQMRTDPWVVALEVQTTNPHPGESIVINGSSYPPSSTCNIYLDSNLLTTLKADFRGDFLLEWSTSRSLALGHHNVSAVAVNYAGPPMGLDAFKATQWPLAVFPNPTNVEKGSILELNGTGFPPLSPVRIYWDGTDYIKAGTTSQGGNMSLGIAVNYPEDDSYHLLRVNVTDAYTGPPSTITHIWLGQDPPNMTLATYDGDWQPRDVFFTDEMIYINGSGYPPLTQMEALVLNASPVAGAGIAPIASASVTTDALGRMPTTPLWTSGGDGEFYLLIDLNLNSIMDGLDLLVEGHLDRRMRPDISVIEVQIDEPSPVQGESIEASFEVSNQGDSPLNTSFNLSLDSTNIWEGTLTGLAPGSSRTLNTTLDTGQLALGLHNVTVTFGALPDETDVLDNSLTGQFEVQSRPDADALLVMPNTTSLLVGDMLGISVIVQNLGDRTESLEVEVLIDSVVIGTQSTPGLLPQASYPLMFVWDTSSEQPRNFTLSARIKELPFEVKTANNEITYGMLTLAIPNLPPVAEPDGPYSGVRGAAVDLDGSASFDSDGEIVSYVWDFGDGNVGEGEVTSHTYGSDGSYRVILNVTDDDGSWSTGITNCRISTPEYVVNLSIIDAVRGCPLQDSDVKLDGQEYSLSDGFMTLSLAPGEYRIRASANQYSLNTTNIVIDGEASLSVSLNPLCRISASDASGVDKVVFSTDDIIYATTTSPEAYESRIYVVSVAPPADQMSIVDITGQDPLTIEINKGSTQAPAWRSNLRDGDYRLILDLNADGIFDISHDRLSPRFSVPEALAQLLACLFALCIMPRTKSGSGLE